MKKRMLILVSALALAFTGCNYAKVENVNEQNTVEEKPSSMFIEVERTSHWKIVYQRDTKVMYAVSYGNYNIGTFILLVNADGSPMIWEE